MALALTAQNWRVMETWQRALRGTRFVDINLGDPTLACVAQPTAARACGTRWDASRRERRCESSLLCRPPKRGRAR